MNRVIQVALLLSFSAVGMVSCSTKSEQPSRRDGSSFTAAIVLNESSAYDCSKAQYAWIALHFPNSRTAEIEKTDYGEVVSGHQTTFQDGRMYSVHSVVSADGAIHRIFFDVTNCGQSKIRQVQRRETGPQ